MDESAREALTARSLRKGFRRGWLRGRVWALAGIDVTIPLGGITALVGPNAAGKSTLIRSWVGFEKPTKGSVRLLGLDPWREAKTIRAKVGYVPQSPTLHPQFSANDYLALSQRWRTSFDRDAAVRQLNAARVDLAAPCGTLSGGQQAQVALALALGTRAPILLLDEPLAQLDPLSRRDFLEVVAQDSRTNGTTVVLSSHIVSDVAQICDSLMVLGNGRVLVHDSIETLLGTHSVLNPSNSEKPAASIGTVDLAGREVLVSHPASHRGPARPATLEEIVLGLLQMARDERSAPSPTHA
jgi:ABC-2 type transport system ATP-binding protein